MCAAERLYGEVNRRLQDAIKNKNMNEITVVQGLLEVATKKWSQLAKTLTSATRRRKKLTQEGDGQILLDSCQVCQVTFNVSMLFVTLSTI